MFLTHKVPCAKSKSRLLATAFCTVAKRNQTFHPQDVLMLTRIVVVAKMAANLSAQPT